MLLILLSPSQQAALHFICISPFLPVHLHCLLVTHPSHFCLLTEQHPLSCLNAVITQLSRRFLVTSVWMYHQVLHVEALLPLDTEGWEDPSILPPVSLPSLPQTSGEQGCPAFSLCSLTAFAPLRILLSAGILSGHKEESTPWISPLTTSKFPQSGSSQVSLSAMQRSRGEMWVEKLTHFHGQVSYSR